MSKNLFFLLLVLLLFSCSSDDELLTPTPEPEESVEIKSDFRNVFAATWVGNNKENLTFAKQMGYDYIFYHFDMESQEESSNMKFYLETPEHMFYARYIDTNKQYTSEEIDFYNRFATLRDASKTFPYNIAPGWFATTNKFSIEPDFQQQAVIDYIVNRTLSLITKLERKNNGFKFGGYAWDVPDLSGDFWDTIQIDDKGIKLGNKIKLDHWTGKPDCGDKHPDVTHEYKTYSDGRAAFYKKLFAETRKKYPDMKTIMEPYMIDRYLIDVEGRNDIDEILPDLFLQEGIGSEFITDSKIFESGKINYTNVGSSSPSILGEDMNRHIFGIAAAKGATFTWFGRLGGSGDMPNYKNIKDVPARLQLIRAIANWENMLQTPLSQRQWNGVIYSSPTAYVSDEVIYGTQPRTNKLFIVFLKPAVTIEIPEALKNAKVYATNDLLQEDSEQTTDLIIKDNRISLTNNERIGKGYILKLD